MSDENEIGLGSEASQDNHGDTDAGVLARLPRTRPQRATARRVAARESPADERPTNGARAPARARSPRSPTAGRQSRPSTRRAPTQASSPSRPAPSSRSARGAARTRPAPRRRPEAPRQGFESDAESTRSVQPPGGLELIASAAEIVGELTKAGFSGSERLVKGVWQRLPH